MRELVSLVSLLALLLLLLGDVAHQSTRVGTLSNETLASGGINSWLAVFVAVATLLWRHGLVARVNLIGSLLMAGVVVVVIDVVLTRLGVVLVLVMVVVLVLVLESRCQTAFPVVAVIVSLRTGIWGRRKGRRG
jgi:hypothetical protein